LSLRLKLAKLSADRVFTESEFHMVGGIDEMLNRISDLTYSVVLTIWYS